MSRENRLDELTNEIEQGFMQSGGWRACRYLLGKLAAEQEAEIERLRTIAKEHRETAEAYQNRYRRLSQAIGHISTIVQEAKQD